MARGFAPSHPVKLRGVFASAVLDRGMSAPAARRALAAGALPGWPGKYDLPLSTGQGYVKAEEERRRELLLGRADPATVQTAVAGQVALLLVELERRAKGINARSTLEEIRELARAQREVVATARACQAGKGGSAAPGQNDTPQPSNADREQSGPDLIDSLAQGKG